MAISNGIEPWGVSPGNWLPILKGILPSTRHRLNTSVLEGMNIRIKVIKWMADGYRDTTYFLLNICATFPSKVR